MESIEELLYDEGYNCFEFDNYKLFTKDLGRYIVTIKHDFVSKLLVVYVADIEQNLKKDFMQLTDTIELLAFDPCMWLFDTIHSLRNDLVQGG